MPELVSQGIIDPDMAEPVSQRLQLGRHHALIGFGEFASALLPQQHSGTD